MNVGCFSCRLFDWQESKDEGNLVSCGPYQAELITDLKKKRDRALGDTAKISKTDIFLHKISKYRCAW